MENKQLIYVVCPNIKKPMGGIKQIYRLVDTLNLLGYEAYILHGKKNFRVKWFENSTAIKYFPNLFAQLYSYTRKKKKLKVPLFLKQLVMDKKMPEKSSLIVFPEVYGLAMKDVVPENNVVIFNQNCYYTFDRYTPENVHKNGYLHPKTLGCIVVSDDSLNYVKHTFPNLDVFRMRLGLSKNFEYSATKKKQIAFMPRKLAEDFNQLFHILNNRMDLSEWDFIAIDNMNEDEVSKVLKDSAFFLSFNYREGFGLPPVEAMACGCYVIGYAGKGGEEYFKDEFCSLIGDRDIIGFAKELEAKILEYDQNPKRIDGKSKLASEYVLSVYNSQNEREDITSIWQNILSN
ncbi:MAG: glycosyltransferase family 1 protein [Pedobacter sp.]|nr:MAG: glycosyltransferase family 1 protein [Pedobacter sp.]